MSPETAETKQETASNPEKISPKDALKGILCIIVGGIYFSVLNIELMKDNSYGVNRFWLDTSKIGATINIALFFLYLYYFCKNSLLAHKNNTHILQKSD